MNKNETQAVILIWLWGAGGLSEHKYVSLRASRVVCLPSDQRQTSFEKPFGECISHNGSLFERRQRTNEVISFSWAASRIVSHSLPTHTHYTYYSDLSAIMPHIMLALPDWMLLPWDRWHAPSPSAEKKGQRFVFFLIKVFFPPRGMEVNHDGRWLTLTLFHFNFPY